MLRVAEAVDGAMRQIAVAACRLRTHAAEFTGGRVHVLNAAYLIDHAERERLIDIVDQLRQAHGELVDIELSGPWPAYSFVEDGGGHAHG
jgi:hypothetical protein